jgi:hypothetical protein
MKENGDVATALQAALTDGRITLAELDSVEKEVHEALTAIVSLRSRVRAMYESQSAKWSA